MGCYPELSEALNPGAGDLYTKGCNNLLVLGRGGVLGLPEYHSKGFSVIDLKWH